MRIPRSFGVFAAWLLVLALPVAAGAATVQTTLTYAGPVPVGVTSLKVENLAGHVTVTRGPSFQVTATVTAGGSSQAAAEVLAQTVKLDTAQDGSAFTLHVHYPVDRYDSYQYPSPKTSADNESGSACFLGLFCFNGSNSNLEYQGTRVRVYTGGGRGTPLHVDLAIQVPANAGFDLLNYVGRNDVSGLQDDVHVKTASADVYASDITGNFGADTGSGDVHVKNLSGDFTADTGSGDVFAESFKGSVHADTGSGDVNLSNGGGQLLYANTGSGDATFSSVTGDMKLDTGSGDVRINGAKGSLHADTGSGEVNATDFTSGDNVWADTGSGDVKLAGDFAALRKLYIDTGSGDATLRTTAELSLHLDASSDSGELNINLPNMRNVVTRRGSFSADFGAAQGKGTISTGSGDITVGGN